jgi:hypothetical protein
LFIDTEMIVKSGAWVRRSVHHKRCGIGLNFSATMRVKIAMIQRLALLCAAVD